MLAVEKWALALLRRRRSRAGWLISRSRLTPGQALSIPASRRGRVAPALRSATRTNSRVAGTVPEFVKQQRDGCLDRRARPRHLEEPGMVLARRASSRRRRRVHRRCPLDRRGTRCLGIAAPRVGVVHAHRVSRALESRGGVVGLPLPWVAFRHRRVGAQRASRLESPSRRLSTCRCNALGVVGAMSNPRTCRLAASAARTCRIARHSPSSKRTPARAGTIHRARSPTASGPARRTRSRGERPPATNP